MVSAPRHHSRQRARDAEHRDRARGEYDENDPGEDVEDRHRGVRLVRYDAGRGFSAQYFRSRATDLPVTVTGRRPLLHLERKDHLPVVLHVDDGPALRRRLVERLVELADVRRAGRRRIRARRRCGGRGRRSARPSPAVVHCSICRSPSELPKAKIGRRPMKRLMPTGLPGPSSMNSTLGSFISTGLPSGADLELHHAGRADHLLGRDAVDLLRPRPHELDAAAGDDEGLEAVGAQIGEQLQHRLVDELGVGPVEARMARGRDPVRSTVLANSSVVMPAWVAATICSKPFSPGAASAFMSPVEHGLERLLSFSIPDAAAPSP